jgi:hypothetical protein
MMAENSTKPAEISVNFVWESLQPDRRQWKPSMPLLKPMDCIVSVKVPLEQKYIDNAEDIIQFQLGFNQANPLPILTPAGMKYCIDRFECVMVEQPVEKVDLSDDEWESISEKETDEWK